MGSSNAGIANTSELVLNGGTFATGGFSETLGPLTLFGDSTIDFGNGASTLTHGGVGTFTAGRVLNVSNWTAGSDHLFIGNAASLTAAQLAQISFNGAAARQLSTGEVVPVTPGDLNRDGAVDHADFLILRAHFGATGATAAQGDVNGDGRVSFADFQILERHFGAASPEAVAGASEVVRESMPAAPLAPEPAKRMVGRPGVVSRLPATFTARRLKISDLLA